MGNAIITNILIRSSCLSDAIVSVWEGEVEYVRTAVPAARTDPDKPEAIMQSGAEIHLDCPLFINGLQVTATSADIGGWHLNDAGVLTIRIK